MNLSFKKGAKAEIGSENVWYALTDGGYLNPADVLADPRAIKAVEEAIGLVQSFIAACYEEGVIEEA